MALTASRRKKIRERMEAEVSKLPEGTARDCGTHLSLEVRGKLFGYYLDDHRGDGRVALNCRGEQGEALASAQKDPAHFHVPKYLGSRGWVGYWLDVPGVDWQTVRGLLVAAYCQVAPKSLLRSTQ